MLEWLEGKYGSRIELTSGLSGQKGNKRGLRVTARFLLFPSSFGCASYGSAHDAYGSKTMSAAYWHALHKLQIAEDERRADEMRPAQEMLFSEAETMV